jgi:predicted RNA-binding Zn-ribbon protein involved in translation (DUF1610 family)
MLCTSCNINVEPINELKMLVCPACLYTAIMSTQILFCYTCSNLVNTLVSEHDINIHNQCRVENNPIINLSIITYKHPSILQYQLMQQFQKMKF